MTISLRSGAVFEPKGGQGTRDAARDARRCNPAGNPSNRNLIRLALTHSFASHARTKRNEFPVGLTPPTSDIRCWWGIP